MSKDEYLITDPPLKALTVFAMPMILGSFFQQVYNMADSIIVGQFVGSSALAAVGACAAPVSYTHLAIPLTPIFQSFLLFPLPSAMRKRKRASQHCPA